jgi:hypothetical protein
MSVYNTISTQKRIESYVQAHVNGSTDLRAVFTKGIPNFEFELLYSSGEDLPIRGTVTVESTSRDASVDVIFHLRRTWPEDSNRIKALYIFQTEV